VTDLRVALIGYGAAGASLHAPLIASVPGLRVAAVVTRDAGRAARARAVLPGVEVLASAEEVWSAADRFDTAVVATPNRSHGPLALAALEAGLPVLVDKPLAPTTAAAQGILDRARVSGELLSVFQNRRWDSDVLTLQRLLAAGELGAVHRFESRFERWRPRVAAGWRSSGDPADGGGVLLDLGSHLVDQALLLWGPVREVYAEVDARRGGDADDDVFLAVTHESGVRSHLWAGALTAARGPRLRVLGSGGALVVAELDSQEAALRDGVSPLDEAWRSAAPGSWATVGTDDRAVRERGPPGDYRSLYVGWRDALLGRGPVPVDPADAVATLRVLDAARVSAVERRVVPVAVGGSPREAT